MKKIKGYAAFDDGALLGASGSLSGLLELVKMRIVEGLGEDGDECGFQLQVEKTELMIGE